MENNFGSEISWEFCYGFIFCLIIVLMRKLYIWLDKKESEKSIAFLIAKIKIESDKLKRSDIE